MAETTDAGLFPRTYFRAPRVPFDFRALGLALLGWVVYWAGARLILEIFDKDVASSFLAAAFRIFAEVPYVGGVIAHFLDTVFVAPVSDMSVVRFPLEDYTFWHVLGGAIWFFAVWTFFSQGIHRITALRIARDEGLSLVEALKFSAKNWTTVLLAPVIIVALIAVMYGCNALAGLVTSIPFVGQILALIVVPLAVISSLLILLVAVGGVFGLPLIGAAAAWERNGSLDAISRAFSYVFARPLQFFWSYFLIFLFVGIVLLVGSWFIFTLTKSVDAGTVFSDEPTVLIDAPPRDNVEGSDYQDLSNDAKELYAKLAEKTGYEPREREAPHKEPYAQSWHGVSQAPWAHKLTALLFWVILNLIWIGVFGYAIYWFLGATTSVYADLRLDVDGTEEDEIYLEEEEEDFEALAAGSTPPPPTPGEGTAGTGTATPPASGPTGTERPGDVPPGSEERPGGPA
jgi:hypothetical protein